MTLRRVEGEVKVQIDKNNVFDYSDKYMKKVVKADFKKRFSGRPYEDESLKDLKEDIEDYMKECVKNNVIMREENVDRLYGGHVLPGGPSYYSSSYVKCY